MAQLSNPIEIFKLLDNSNCRKCGYPTCMAFAAAVYNGQKKLGDCPKLDRETLERFEGEVEAKQPLEKQVEETIAELRKEISRIDLEEAARRLDAPYSNGRITIKILGRDFSVDQQGNIFTSIHVNMWVINPVFNYIIHGDGLEPTGNWVPLRELEGGDIRYPLFKQRSENPCRRVADSNPEFFDMLVRMFDARRVEDHYESDISQVLHPLPKVPVLICYWKPEDGMDSSLNFFFDDTADKNLGAASLYILTAGMVNMFEKLAATHGVTA